MHTLLILTDYLDPPFAERLRGLRQRTDVKHSSVGTIVLEKETSKGLRFRTSHFVYGLRGRQADGPALHGTGSTGETAGILGSTRLILTVGDRLAS